MDPYAAAGYGAPNPFGPYAGPTGAPQNMALVPVGMNPMMMGGAIVPYGMGPFGGMNPMAGEAWLFVRLWLDLCACAGAGAWHGDKAGALTALQHFEIKWTGVL